MPHSLKTGKQPATYDGNDLRFENYRITGTVLPIPPHEFGQYGLVPADWGMLGNDNYGDCVLAMADHESMLFNAEGGTQVLFTPDNALADYAALTGFNPDDPSSDQGTNMRDAMNYRRRTGVIDAHGRRHQIGAYVALEPGNKEHVQEALYLFGAVSVGIEFPDYAMDLFNRGKNWSVHPGGTIEGGHAITIVGKRANHFLGVTWGKLIVISWSFLAKYMDEGYAPLSLEVLNKGVNVLGYNVEELKQDLAALSIPGGNVSETSDPSQTPPTEPGAPEPDAPAPVEPPAQPENPDAPAPTPEGDPGVAGPGVQGTPGTSSPAQE